MTRQEGQSLNVLEKHTSANVRYPSPQDLVSADVVVDRTYLVPPGHCRQVHACVYGESRACAKGAEPTIDEMRRVCLASALKSSVTETTGVISVGMTLLPTLMQLGDRFLGLFGSELSTCPLNYEPPVWRIPGFFQSFKTE